MKVSELAQSLSIRCEDLGEFLAEQGFAGYEPESEVPDLLVDAIRLRFSASESFVGSMVRKVRGIFGKNKERDSFSDLPEVPMETPDDVNLGETPPEASLEGSPSDIDPGESPADDTESLLASPDESIGDPKEEDNDFSLALDDLLDKALLDRESVPESDVISEAPPQESVSSEPRDEIAVEVDSSLEAVGRTDSEDKAPDGPIPDESGEEQPASDDIGDTIGAIMASMGPPENEAEALESLGDAEDEKKDAVETQSQDNADSITPSAGLEETPDGADDESDELEDAAEENEVAEGDEMDDILKSIVGGEIDEEVDETESNEEDVSDDIGESSDETQTTSEEPSAEENPEESGEIDLEAILAQLSGDKDKQSATVAAPQESNEAPAGEPSAAAIAAKKSEEEDEIDLSDLLEISPVGLPSEGYEVVDDDEDEPSEDVDADVESQGSSRSSSIPGLGALWNATMGLRSSFSSLIDALPTPVLVVIFGGILVLCGTVGGVYHAYSQQRAPGRDEILWRRAQRCFSEGRYEDAIKNCHQVQRFYGSKSDHYRASLFMVGECYYLQNDYETALQVLLPADGYLRNKTIEVDGVLYPDFTLRGKGKLMLAECLFRTGRFREAQKAYEEIIGDEIQSSEDALSPLGVKASLDLAEMYRYWGDKEGDPVAYSLAVQEYYELLAKPMASEAAEEGTVQALRGIAASYERLADAKRDEYRDHMSLALEHYRKAENAITPSGPSEPSRVDLRMAAARIEANLDKWGESAKTYSAIIDLLGDDHSEKDLRATLGFVRALVELHEFEAAEAELEGLIKNLKSLPEDLQTETLFLWGDTCWEMKRFDEMLEAYKAALSSDSKWAEGDYGQRAHMRMTNVLYARKRDYEAAVEKYREIITKYPNGAYTLEAQFRLAQSLAQLGRYEDAAYAYRSLITTYYSSSYQDPTILADAYYSRADAWFAAGQKGRAIEALKEALQVLDFPEDERGRKARLALANAYSDLCFYDKALPIYRFFLNKFPEQDRDGRIAMATARCEEERLNCDAAREIHNTVIRDHSGEPVARDARLALARNLYRSSEFAPEEERARLATSALLELERCYQDYPENTEPLFEIGRINHRNRDFVKARTYLKKFLSNPGVSDTSPEARFLLGDADYQLRDYAGAVEAFSALKSADLPERDGAQMLYELADSYREIGNASKAKEHLSTLARNYASTDWGTEAERLLKDVAWNEQHL